MPFWKTSISMRWVSVPPEMMRKPSGGDGFGQNLCVGDDLRGIGGLKLGLERLVEGDCLGGDDVHQRAALLTGEDAAVNT